MKFEFLVKEETVNECSQFWGDTPKYLPSFRVDSFEGMESMYYVCIFVFSLSFPPLPCLSELTLLPILSFLHEKKREGGRTTREKNEEEKMMTGVESNLILLLHRLLNYLSRHQIRKMSITFLMTIIIIHLLLPLASLYLSMQVVKKFQRKPPFVLSLHSF